MHREANQPPPSSSTCVPAPKRGEEASPSTAFAAHEGRAGCLRGPEQPEAKDHDDPIPERGFRPQPHPFQTAWALQELQLYGTRAFQDEVDLRPMPEPERLIDAVSDIFDALAATLGDTRMEPDLEELLWGPGQPIPPRRRPH